MKKIGLLTMPILDNYGGIIQIAALYHILEKNGFQPILINKRYNQSLLKVLFKEGLSNNPFYRVFDYNNHAKRRQSLKHISSFINNFFISKTPPLYNERSLINATKGLDTVVVGSDQVWRYKYVKENYKHYFLNFVNSDTRKVAYAASFGVDDWEGDNETRENVKKLLMRFDAVGVRESEGVEICVNELDYHESQQVLDPTLLPDVSFYDSIIEKEHLNKNVSLFNYVLDRSDEKRAIINYISKTKGLDIDTISLNDTINYGELKPSIGEWLYHLKNAEFVITDSFHGTVFSIIFNKQFIAIGNKERGISRFMSLLKLFNLESRLVLDNNIEQIKHLINNDIDYNKVNANLKIHKETSLRFLLSKI